MNVMCTVVIVIVVVVVVVVVVVALIRHSSAISQRKTSAYESDIIADVTEIPSIDGASDTSQDTPLDRNERVQKLQDLDNELMFQLPSASV